ncbi:MAG: phosphate ABC transporter substrate-binding protein [Bacillota bacterium]
MLLRCKMQRVLISILLVLGLIVGGCGRSRADVTVSGSTVLLPLARDAAAGFAPANAGAVVNVSGGGSYTGLQQVACGLVDIGASEVEPPAGDPKFKGLVDHVVALCPFLLIAHRDVGVDNLTADQASGIFTGRIKNWREVGGKDLKITIVNRPKSSGSRRVIKDLVLRGQEFTGDARVVNSNVELREAVAKTPGAIGFVDAANLEGTVKTLKYDSVVCSRETITNGAYPLWALEHMYTKGEPKGAVEAYLEFMCSASFREKIKSRGFLLPSEMKKQK